MRWFGVVVLALVAGVWIGVTTWALTDPKRGRPLSGGAWRRATWVCGAGFLVGLFLVTEGR